MSELQIFKNAEFGFVRTITVEGEPYFVAKDITGILGYANASKAIADHVDVEDKLNNESLSSLGQRGGWLINESGLYSLILSSKMPNAKRFKRWVTSEVLPTIRKHGLYAMDEVLANPDIPPRVYKEMAHLNKQRDKLNQLLNGVNVFNAKSRAGEINKLLDSYIPAVEQMQTQLKKYKRAFTDTVMENQELKKENEKLELSLEKAQKKSVSKAIKDMQLQRDYENAVELLEHIPKEILEMYAKMPKEKEKKIDRILR